MKNIILGVAAAAAIIITPGMSAAQEALTCSSLKSSRIGERHMSYLTAEASQAIEARPVLFPTAVSVVLDVGDVLNVSSVGFIGLGGEDGRRRQAAQDQVRAALPLNQGEVTLTTPDDKDREAVPTQLTATTAGVHTVSDLAYSGLRVGNSLVTVRVTCTPAPVDEADEETAEEETTDETVAELGGVSAFNQTSTILRGLGSLPGTPNGGTVQASRDGLFFGQGDAASGWRAWGFADVRRYSDGASGRSFGMTLGADYNLGAVRAGVLMAYDTTTLDQGGGDQSVRSVAVGPYVTGQAGQFSYDAFATLSRPEYDLLGGEVTGKRLTYGLRGQTAIDARFGTVQPYISVNGANEDVDSDSLTSIYQAAGVRVDFATQGNALPYISMAFTNNRIDSELTGSSEHQSMRYGVGVSQVLSNGGILGLDLESGEAIEGIRDVGLRISYTLDF